MDDLHKDIKDLNDIITNTSKMTSDEWKRDSRSKSYSTKETYLNMLKNKRKKYIDQLKSDVNEVTTTGAVAGVNTPFAFSRRGIGNKKAAKQNGYKVVSRYNENFDLDQNNDGEINTGDAVIAARKAAGMKNKKYASIKNRINKIIKSRKNKRINEGLKSILHKENAESFDVTSTYNTFQTKLNNLSNELKTSLQKSLLNKILGKKIKVTSSKGQGQMISDYIVNVTGVEISYVKNKYIIEIIGKEQGKSSTKRYYLDTNSPITIIGNSESLKPKDLERINTYKQMFGGETSDQDTSVDKNVTSDDSPEKPKDDELDQQGSSPEPTPSPKPTP